MPKHQPADLERLAAEARSLAGAKDGSRESRVAGHLALAYEALARAQRDHDGKDSDELPN